MCVQAGQPGRFTKSNWQDTAALKKWWAPEALRGQPVSAASDMVGVGNLILTVLEKTKLKYTSLEHIATQCRSLDPAKRPKMETVMIAIAAGMDGMEDSGDGRDGG